MSGLDLTAIAERWHRVTPHTSDAMREARELAHWAVQPVGSFGDALVAAQRDFSHVSVEWDVDTHRFLSGRSQSGVRAALALDPLELMLLDPSGATIETHAVVGKTLEDAFNWMNASLVRLDLQPTDPVKVLDHELPPHPYGSGEAFRTGDPEALAELARWFDNGSLVANAVREQIQGASPVRCWPHHFDIATLITIDGDEPDPEKARSIGFGLTPPDKDYDEWYFYTAPWPIPAPEGLTALDGVGQWHTTGWVGTVLPAQRIASGGAPDQAEQVAAFVASAIPATRRLLKK